VYWLLTENYVLNANILVFMLIHTELFSNVSALGLGLEKNFGPRPRPHSFWPRPRPWPHAQLASLTSLVLSLYCVIIGEWLLESLLYKLTDTDRSIDG